MSTQRHEKGLSEAGESSSAKTGIEASKAGPELRRLIREYATLHAIPGDDPVGWWKGD